MTPPDVRIERFDAPRPLAVVRLRAAQAELSKVIPQACGKVWDLTKKLGITGAGRLVAVYLNCEIDLEVGVELPQPIADGGGLFASALPAGKVATAIHMGPYPQLKQAHDAIHQWCSAQGQQLAGPSWEIYGHWLTE